MERTRDPSVRAVPPGWGRARRVTFFVWAAVLSLVCGVTFIGVTVLTIGLWLAHRNSATHPVVDLGFFALGAVIITTGFVVQLWAPEHNLAGLQQATAGLLALGVSGLIGGRIEPLAGATLLLLATALLAALHPARRGLLALRKPRSPPLLALSLVATLPATLYAASMLVQAQRAGPSCFLGRCAYGDRFAEMAALAIAIAALGFLAASKPRGWLVTAWSAGFAAAIVGATFIAWPELPGSLGRIAGATVVLWGAVFVAAATWEVRLHSR